MANQKTHLVRDIEKDVKNDIKAAKKIPRLPWWTVVEKFVGTPKTFEA